MEQLAARLGAVPGISSLALTTNGLLLRAKLDALVRAGVSHVNISLDTLDEARFMVVTRRRGHGRVLEAIDAALGAGLRAVKVNAVVMRGVNEDELSAFVEWTRHKAVEVRFIEYMPFGDNAWREASFMAYRDMLAAIRATHPTLEALPGDPSDTARLYRVPGYAGTVGFIASMSAAFCAGCTRIRLTADGNLKTCLFGEDEVSLRDPLRAGASDEELAAIVRRALAGKHAVLGGHADRFELAKGDNRPMILIGG